MSKLIIMKGLPASGKSTKSKELLEQGNTVRLNKDLLRTMLHFDKFNGRNEGLTRDAQRALAKMFLSKGTSVIIDDTNLNHGTMQGWVDLAKEVGAKIQHENIDTPVDVCIQRDFERGILGERFVGKSVIQKMALQYLDYMKGEKVVICDLDGTLCNIEHRLQYAKGETKDWKKFFAGISEDKLRHEVMEELMIIATKENAKIIFVSARPNDYRKDTEKWLRDNLYFKYESLIMRESNDKRDDTEVKSDIYDKYLKNLDIVAVFDDRPKVIRMWKEKGLNVIDVGQGIEF